MRKRPWSSVTTIFAYLVGRSSVSAMTHTPACGFAGPRLATPRTTPLMLLAEGWLWVLEGRDFPAFLAATALPAARTRMRRIVVVFIVPRLSLKYSAEPGEREPGGEQDEHPGHGGEDGADLGLLRLEDEARVEALVHLLQVGRAARVEVLAARDIGDVLQRLFVEPHAHRPALD